ncbi:MAG: transglycosylase SLT domain-containing protein [Deltaproteobacteria bacterium]|nr:transglycosylase SLT domain-containing protein [Deltaproteobacteria bacterium]
MFKKSLLIILVGLLSACASKTHHPALKKNFLKGYEALNENNADQAILSFEQIKNLDVGMRDYILYYLGKAYLKAERCEEAHEVFRELISEYPKSRWSGVARFQGNHCPPLEEIAEKPKPILCEDFPHLRDQAECFFSRRQYRSAKELYAQLAMEGAPGSLDDLIRLSQSATRSQDYEMALKTNFRIRELYPQKAVSRTALHNIAYLYQASGQYREAILLMQSLLEEADSPRKRRQWFEKIGWDHYRLGGWSNAVEAFDQSLAEEESAFSLYWKGRSLERLKRKKEAKETYRSLLDRYPATYYGIRAVSRLHGSPSGGVLKGWWPRTFSLRWYQEKLLLEPSEDLKRIEELKSLQLEKDAEVEIRKLRAEKRYPLPGDLRKIKKEKDNFVIKLRIPRTEHLVYRLPYADFLLSQAALRGETNPYLLYAMMRQESQYRESVVSPVGAIGLLQVMPLTGERLAEEAKWSFFEREWLFEPMTNIELAVLYIDKLSRQFDQKWYLIAAAYNAGEAVVENWQRDKSALSEEEFIEEIPYQETRDYVKKIYTNWAAYRWIYQ